MREGAGGLELWGFSPVQWARSASRTGVQDMVQPSRALPPVCTGAPGPRGAAPAPASALPGVEPLHAQFPVAIPDFLGLCCRLGGRSRGGLCGSCLGPMEAFREEAPAWSSRASAQEARLESLRG